VLGLLSACFGAGALAGALLSASTGRADMRLLLGGGTLLGIAEILVAPQRTVAATAALLVTAGVGFSLYAANSNAMLQLAVPDRLRGRVLSLYAYVFFGTAPVGGYLAGWLSERGGTVLAFAVAGATAMLTVAFGVAWWWRRGAPQVRARRPQLPAEVLSA
jgi:MFS family permease